MNAHSSSENLNRVVPLLLMKYGDLLCAESVYSMQLVSKSCRDALKASSIWLVKCIQYGLCFSESTSSVEELPELHPIWKRLVDMLHERDCGFDIRAVPYTTIQLSESVGIRVPSSGARSAGRNLEIVQKMLRDFYDVHPSTITLASGNVASAENRVGWDQVPRTSTYRLGKKKQNSAKNSTATSPVVGTAVTSSSKATSPSTVTSSLGNKSRGSARRSRSIPCVTGFVADSWRVRTHAAEISQVVAALRSGNQFVNSYVQTSFDNRPNPLSIVIIGAETGPVGGSTVSAGLATTGSAAGTTTGSVSASAGVSASATAAGTARTSQSANPGIVIGASQPARPAALPGIQIGPAPAAAGRPSVGSGAAGSSSVPVTTGARASGPTSTATPAPAPTATATAPTTTTATAGAASKVSQARAALAKLSGDISGLDFSAKQGPGGIFLPGTYRLFRSWTLGGDVSEYGLNLGSGAQGPKWTNQHISSRAKHELVTNYFHFDLGYSSSQRRRDSYVRAGPNQLATMENQPLLSYEQSVPKNYLVWTHDLQGFRAVVKPVGLAKVQRESASSAVAGQPALGSRVLLGANDPSAGSTGSGSEAARTSTSAAPQVSESAPESRGSVPESRGSVPESSGSVPESSGSLQLLPVDRPRAFLQNLPPADLPDYSTSPGLARFVLTRIMGILASHNAPAGNVRVGPADAATAQEQNTIRQNLGLPDTFGLPPNFVLNQHPIQAAGALVGPGSVLSRMAGTANMSTEQIRQLIQLHEAAINAIRSTVPAAAMVPNYRAKSSVPRLRIIATGPTSPGDGAGELGVGLTGAWTVPPESDSIKNERWLSQYSPMHMSSSGFAVPVKLLRKELFGSRQEVVHSTRALVERNASVKDMVLRAVAALEALETKAPGRQCLCSSVGQSKVFIKTDANLTFPVEWNNILELKAVGQLFWCAGAQILVIDRTERKVKQVSETTGLGALLFGSSPSATVVSGERRLEVVIDYSAAIKKSGLAGLMSRLPSAPEVVQEKRRLEEERANQSALYSSMSQSTRQLRPRNSSVSVTSTSASPTNNGRNVSDLPDIEMVVEPQISSDDGSVGHADGSVGRADQSGQTTLGSYLDLGVSTVDRFAESNSSRSSGTSERGSGSVDIVRRQEARLLRSTEEARQFEYHPSWNGMMLVGSRYGVVSLVNANDDFVECRSRIDCSALLGLGWLKAHSNLAVYASSNSGIIGMLRVGGDDHCHPSLGIDHQPIGRFKAASSVSVNATDDYLLVSGFSRDLGLFDLPTGRKIKDIKEAHHNYINIVRFANQNPFVFATSSFDCVCKLWDLRVRNAQAFVPEENELRSLPPSTVGRYDSRVMNVMCHFSSDDSRLLVSGLDNALVELNTKNTSSLALTRDYSTLLKPRASGTNYRRAVYMGPSGSHILTSGTDESTVNVLSCEDQQLKETINFAGCLSDLPWLRNKDNETSSKSKWADQDSTPSLRSFTSSSLPGFGPSSLRPRVSTGTQSGSALVPVSSSSADEWQLTGEYVQSFRADPLQPTSLGVLLFPFNKSNRSYIATTEVRLSN